MVDYLKLCNSFHVTKIRKICPPPKSLYQSANSIPWYKKTNEGFILTQTAISASDWWQEDPFKMNSQNNNEILNERRHHNECIKNDLWPSRQIWRDTRWKIEHERFPLTVEALRNRWAQKYKCKHEASPLENSFILSRFIRNII